MKEALLFVDDEVNVLRAVERLFMDSEYRVLVAQSGEEALDTLNSEKVAVLVSDNMMPGMNGIELLRRAGEVSPNTIKVLMTAYADLKTAIEAINKSEIFRFVVKPWNNAELEAMVEDCVVRYHLLESLRGADEATMLCLAQTIELKDPYTKGHCERVAGYAVSIADRLGFDESYKKEIRYGGWLHDCGKIGVPESILNTKGALTEEEFEVIKKHCRWGAEVARLANLPQRVQNIIMCHHEKFDGSGYPQGLSGESIPFEARIVSVADVYDALTTVRPYQKDVSRFKAMEKLVELKNRHFDPTVVHAFVEALIERGAKFGLAGGDPCTIQDRHI